MAIPHCRAGGKAFVTPPAVRFDAVVKRYGDLTVLDGINFSVGQGEKLAIIGPSGSGKSTLLRVLMTLEPFQEGRISVHGQTFLEGAEIRDDAATRAIRRRIGMVFQHFNLFPHMTALQNVAEAPRRVLKTPKREAHALAAALLTDVGLGDKLDHRPASLSGGQQQRVAIARALAMRPEIMLFDEVTSALDPELVGEVTATIRRIGEERPITMLVVTHQMEFARSFADRVAFFYGGEVHEEGAPDEIFTEPKNERTRQFLRAVLAAR
ncbi:MAG: ectoine/hydroxyectoine ABC transporter ATP-binding protein EhuA [Pseudomonadota bacterium]